MLFTELSKTELFIELKRNTKMVKTHLLLILNSFQVLEHPKASQNTFLLVLAMVHCFKCFQHLGVDSPKVVDTWMLVGSLKGYQIFNFFGSILHFYIIYCM